MDTELDMKLDGLQLELIDSFDGELVVLRGYDDLCICDEHRDPIACVSIEQDEDGDDLAVVVFAEHVRPNIAAAVAVLIDDVMPVFVDCDVLFTATKSEFAEDAR